MACLTSRPTFGMGADSTVLPLNVLTPNFRVGLSNSEFVGGKFFNALPVEPIFFFSNSPARPDVSQSHFIHGLNPGTMKKTETFGDIILDMPSR